MIYALYVVGALLVLIALIVVAGALRPSQFKIVRSLLIGASADRLFPYINNLKTFHEWNPFKDKDPNAHNEFSGPDQGPGAKFRWVGNANAGEGIMTIVNSVQNHKVDLDLEFIKPFPGRNAVEFSLAPQSGGTLVTWSMEGKYALIPKIVGMFLNMDKMIGGDFEKGLSRLKNIAENR